MSARAATRAVSNADARFPERITVIDSHTEGEPTRVVIAGWPALRGTDMAARRLELMAEWNHLRHAVVCEPRGHDAVVGALLTDPVGEGAVAGVIFFNNVGCLGMCGHGLIGVVRTLAHLGRVATGAVSIDTPVGRVSARIEDDGAITIGNVPARCHALDVAVSVPGLGTVTGDIAYGGNWFFIARSPGIPLEPGNVSELTRVCRDLLSALRVQNITGADGADIDHIELTAPSAHGDADAVNFVLCPGGAWDRSPCGTGTSAKLAVMHARSELKPRQRWRQQSVTGGVFTAWLEERNGELHPFIRGRAWITGEAQLRFEPDDPLRGGFSTP
jgi:4-hydroxyproline epimerase